MKAFTKGDEVTLVEEVKATTITVIAKPLRVRIHGLDPMNAVTGYSPGVVVDLTPIELREDVEVICTDGNGREYEITAHEGCWYITSLNGRLLDQPCNVTVEG